MNVILSLDPDLMEFANSGGEQRLLIAIQAQMLRDLRKMVPQPKAAAHDASGPPAPPAAPSPATPAPAKAVAPAAA
jgi:hypothetical protein